MLRRSNARVWLLGAFCLLASPIARARAGDAQQPAPTRVSAIPSAPPAHAGKTSTPRFYGWQILVTQSTAFALATTHLLASSHQDNLGPLTAELGAGTLGGILIPWGQGYPLRGFVGFGVHLGAASSGFIASMNLACSDGCTDEESTRAIVLGLGIGSLLGAAVDAWVLGWDAPLPDFDAPRPARASFAPAIVPLPILSVTRERATLGFALRF
jgi:hypothetical protein